MWSTYWPYQQDAIWCSDYYWLRYVTASNGVNWFNINFRLFRTATDDDIPHGWNKTGWHLRGISSPALPCPAEVISLSFWLPCWCKFGKLANCVLYKKFLKSSNTNSAGGQQGLCGGCWIIKVTYFQPWMKILFSLIVLNLFRAGIFFYFSTSCI